MDRTSFRIQIALLLSHEIGLCASEISKLSLGDIYTEEGRVCDRLQVNGARGSRILTLRSVKLRAALANHYDKSFRDRHLDDLTPLIRYQCGGVMTPASLARLMTSVYRAENTCRDLPEGRRVLARAEVEHFANVIEEQAIWIQIGVVTESLPHTHFQIFRMADTKMLTVSPFRSASSPTSGWAWR